MSGVLKAGFCVDRKSLCISSINYLIEYLLGEDPRKYPGYFLWEVQTHRNDRLPRRDSSLSCL